MKCNIVASQLAKEALHNLYFLKTIKAGFSLTCRNSTSTDFFNKEIGRNSSHMSCCCCISVLALYCCLSALCALLRICALSHVLKLMLLPAHNPQSGSPLPSHHLCTLTGDHPTRGNQPKDSLMTQCSTIFFFFFFEKPSLTHSAQFKNMHPLYSPPPIIYIMHQSISPLDEGAWGVSRVGRMNLGGVSHSTEIPTPLNQSEHQYIGLRY